MNAKLTWTAFGTIFGVLVVIFGLGYWMTQIESLARVTAVNTGEIKDEMTLLRQEAVQTGKIVIQNQAEIKNLNQRVSRLEDEK